MPVGELLASMALRQIDAIVGEHANGEVLTAWMAAIQSADDSLVHAPVLALNSERTMADDVMSWVLAGSAANARATQELRTTVLTDGHRSTTRSPGRERSLWLSRTSPGRISDPLPPVQLHEAVDRGWVRSEGMTRV